VFKVLTLVLLLTAAGCASQSSILVTGAQPTQKVTKTQRSFLWGMIASDTLWDPRDRCQYGVSKIEVTSVFSLIGVYASYDIAAWCSAPSAAAGLGVPGAGAGPGVLILR
jgi:hypothetical protein